MLVLPSQTLSDVQHSSSELRYDLRECRTQLCRVLGPILQNRAEKRQKPVPNRKITAEMGGFVEAAVAGRVRQHPDGSSGCHLEPRLAKTSQSRRD